MRAKFKAMFARVFGGKPGIFDHYHVISDSMYNDLIKRREEKALQQKRARRDLIEACTVIANHAQGFCLETEMGFDAFCDNCPVREHCLSEFKSFSTDRRNE